MLKECGFLISNLLIQLEAYYVKQYHQYYVYSRHYKQENEALHFNL